ncbi:MAG TPA: helix-turn-helix domain-containing protein [Rhizobium sp.]
MIDELSEEEVKSFTSWKLDILDAISCDMALHDIDVRVAFRLMQHVNARTRDAHPSLERIAAQVGVSRDTVMRSLTRMCDAEGGRHWINRARADRTQPYTYSFVTGRLNAVVDGKIDREDRAREAAQEKKRKRFEVAAVQPREVANDAVFEVANGEVFEVAAVQPKHLHNNYLNRTPYDSCSEGGEDTYTREHIPTEEIDFALWIKRNIPDPAHHREALRLLRERKMTPEILRRLAA